MRIGDKEVVSTKVKWRGRVNKQEGGGRRMGRDAPVNGGISSGVIEMIPREEIESNECGEKRTRKRRKRRRERGRETNKVGTTSFFSLFASQEAATSSVLVPVEKRRPAKGETKRAERFFLSVCVTVTASSASDQIQRLHPPLLATESSSRCGEKVRPAFELGDKFVEERKSFCATVSAAGQLRRLRLTTAKYGGVEALTRLRISLVRVEKGKSEEKKEGVEENVPPEPTTRLRDFQGEVERVALSMRPARSLSAGHSYEGSRVENEEKTRRRSSTPFLPRLASNPAFVDRIDGPVVIYGPCVPSHAN